MSFSVLEDALVAEKAARAALTNAYGAAMSVLIVSENEDYRRARAAVEEREQFRHMSFMEITERESSARLVNESAGLEVLRGLLEQSHRDRLVMGAVARKQEKIQKQYLAKRNATALEELVAREDIARVRAECVLLDALCRVQVEQNTKGFFSEETSSRLTIVKSYKLDTENVFMAEKQDRMRVSIARDERLQRQHMAVLAVQDAEATVRRPIEAEGLLQLRTMNEDAHRERVIAEVMNKKVAKIDQQFTSGRQTIAQEEQSTWKELYQSFVATSEKMASDDASRRQEAQRMFEAEVGRLFEAEQAGRLSIHHRFRLLVPLVLLEVGELQRRAQIGGQDRSQRLYIKTLQWRELEADARRQIEGAGLSRLRVLQEQCHRERVRMEAAARRLARQQSASVQQGGDAAVAEWDNTVRSFSETSRTSDVARELAAGNASPLMGMRGSHSTEVLSGLASPRGAVGGLASPRGGSASPLAMAPNEQVADLQKALADKDFWLERVERDKMLQQTHAARQVATLQREVTDLQSRLEQREVDVHNAEREAKEARAILHDSRIGEEVREASAELQRRSRPDRFVQCTIFPNGDPDIGVEPAYDWVMASGSGAGSPKAASPVTRSPQRLADLAANSRVLGRVPGTTTALAQTEPVVVLEHAEYQALRHVAAGAPLPHLDMSANGMTPLLSHRSGDAHALMGATPDAHPQLVGSYRSASDGSEGMITSRAGALGETARMGASLENSLHHPNNMSRAFEPAALETNASLVPQMTFTHLMTSTPPLRPTHVHASMNTTPRLQPVATALPPPSPPPQPLDDTMVGAAASASLLAAAASTIADPRVTTTVVPLEVAAAAPPATVEAPTVAPAAVAPTASWWGTIVGMFQQGPQQAETQAAIPADASGTQVLPMSPLSTSYVNVGSDGDAASPLSQQTTGMFVNVFNRKGVNAARRHDGTATTAVSTDEGVAAQDNVVLLPDAAVEPSREADSSAVGCGDAEESDLNANTAADTRTIATHEEGDASTMSATERRNAARAAQLVEKLLQMLQRARKEVDDDGYFAPLMATGIAASFLFFR